MTALFHLEVEEGSYNFFFITVTFYHSMGTCAAQPTCLRKVCGHVTVSDHRLSKPEGFNVSCYVYMW